MSDFLSDGAGVPFPQRSDTMWLQTVQKKDVLKGRIWNYDVQGAHDYETPKFKPGRPKYPEPHQKTYYPPVNRFRDFSLTTSDIEGAQARRGEHSYGQRCTNPVDPIYKFATPAPCRPPTPPRYSGHATNDISDIEGTSGTKPPERNYVRNLDTTNLVHDPTDYPKFGGRNGRGFRDLGISTNLSVRDINCKTPPKQRGTDPLEPVYTCAQAPTTSLHVTYSQEKVQPPTHQAPKLKPEKIGPVDGSTSRKLHVGKNAPLWSLKKDDISGASPQRWAGEVPCNIYESQGAKPALSFHDPHDVAGAQVGTFKKGITTKRSINPLQPTYTLLDGKIVPSIGYKPQNALDAERFNAKLGQCYGRKIGTNIGLKQTKSAASLGDTAAPPQPAVAMQKLSHSMSENVLSSRPTAKTCKDILSRPSLSSGAATIPLMAGGTLSFRL